MKGIGSIVSFVVSTFEEVGRSTGKTSVARVRGLGNEWFDRTVRRPVVGRMCDTLVTDGPLCLVFLPPIAVAMMVVFGSHLLVLSAWNWLSEVAALQEILYMALTPLVIVWIFMNITVIGMVCSGVSRGFDEWRRLYACAKAREWGERHPGHALDTGCVSWRYRRG
jgi:hypothetical protein